MDLQRLLTNLIAAAESKDEAKVKALNHDFEELVFTTHPLFNEYDNLRQSCLFAVKKDSKFYETFLADAKERFKRIYEHDYKTPNGE